MGVCLPYHRHGIHALRPGFVESCSEKILSGKEDLRGQTVAVVGLGVSGRAAVKLALARGATVLAVDQNENLILPEHINLQTRLGTCCKELLEDADRIVVSPGVTLDNYNLISLLQTLYGVTLYSKGVTVRLAAGHETIANLFTSLGFSAMSQGRPVMSELDFAAEVLPKSIRLLAVTGTNGKSTVVTFAGQMLKHLGIKAFVGGNLGIPLSEAAAEFLESSSAGSLFQAAVVEVSSYQMEIPSKFFCPSVAMVLNLTPDHLERHKTMWNYAAMKCRIFSHMTHGKLAILPSGNQFLKSAFKDYAESCNFACVGDLPGVMVDMEAKVASLGIPGTGLISQLELGSLGTLGTHNLHNAAVAAFSVLGLDVGVDIDSINSVIERLHPPPHRMQIVRRDVHGVIWVDDSKATNVEATSVGLTGLRDKKSVVLLGGLAKVLSAEGSFGFEQLVEPLKYHRAVITFGSSGPMIQKELVDAGLSIPCIGVTDMKDAVSFARRIARYGDAIVLSPGCASFDEFRNFEHRGKVFQELAHSDQ